MSEKSVGREWYERTRDRTPDPRDAELARLRVENSRLEADCDARVTAAQVERDVFRQAVARLTRELAEAEIRLWGVLDRISPSVLNAPGRDTPEKAVSMALGDFYLLINDSNAVEQREATLRAALTPFVNRCGELFSEIRGDWTDPRNECREGWAVCDQMRALLAPETTEPPVQE